MSEDLQISQLYAAVGMWARRHGADKLNEQDGLWERDAGNYTVSINGHPHPLRSKHGITVEPYHFLVHQSEMVMSVALIAPNGGIITGLDEGELIAFFEADASEAALNGEKG